MTILLGRRHVLQALGLGAVAALANGGKLARADIPTAPTRIVFYVQPHGHVPNAWHMDIPGAPDGVFAERSLIGLAPEELSVALRPLHPFRDRVLTIDGLCHTSALFDIAEVMRTGGDLNNHQIGVADVLSGTRALQRDGTYCTGGARTLDQELAVRLVAPGRFDSRVYGFDYIPNSIVSPFSYLGPGKATPMVSDPRAAFADLLGYAKPPSAPTTRAEAIRAMRPSVLDTVAREYAFLAPRLGAEGRQKLEQHQTFIRELEASLGAASGSPSCNPTFDGTGQVVRQFMKLVRLAFACDLTRVVTFSAPVPACPELGYPADSTFHSYAHQSIQGATSCGQAYEPIAAQAMTDLDAWHAAHVAFLLQELDSVAEGAGTLLDHTVVVWISELATPTHLHYDAFTVLAGGGNGFFDTGRYVRYARDQPNPVRDQPKTGPAHNRLLVSLLQAMGQTDTSFGLTGAVAADGTPLSFRDPLRELHRT